MIPPDRLRNTAQKKGGRPRGDPSGGLREKTLGVRVSEAEYVEICKKAEAVKLRPTEWVREAALSRHPLKPTVPKINLEEYSRLGRLAANLNQLTRMANSHGHSLDALNQAILIDLLRELAKEVQKLRSALVGRETNDWEDTQENQL